MSADPSTSVVPGLRSLRRKALIGILGAVLVVTVMALIADARDLAHELRSFSWWLVFPILLCTIWNYALRYGKWEIYLAEIHVPRLPRWTSIRIFLAGFAMALTPGKVGEFIKAIYVRRENGTPANRVMAIVTAERATDAAAMAVLAAVGTLRYAYGREFLGLVVVIGVAGVFLLQRPHLLHRPLDLASGIDLVARIREQVHAFLETSSTLFRGRLLAGTVLLTVVSWAGECVAFFLVLIGLGLDPSLELLVIATFVLAVSSLAGGVSMIPGGLGVADASMAGMLILFVDDGAMTKSVAVAATLLIRFATLWFGVLIGAIALGSLERQHSRGRLPVLATRPNESSAGRK